MKIKPITTGRITEENHENEHKKTNHPSQKRWVICYITSITYIKHMEGTNYYAKEAVMIDIE